jgi:hypothetical protein
VAARTDEEVVEGQKTLVVVELHFSERDLSDRNRAVDHFRNNRFCFAGLKGQQNSVESGWLRIDRDDRLRADVLGRVRYESVLPQGHYYIFASEIDPAGRRATKVISGTSTNFLYDLANPVQELFGTTPTANLLTGGLDEYLTRTDSTGTSNFLTDVVGSTATLTDPTGVIKTQYTFAAASEATLYGGIATGGEVVGIAVASTAVVATVDETIAKAYCRWSGN